MKLWEKLMGRHFAVPIIDRVFNVSGQIKALYCRECDLVTRHSSISHQEVYIEGLKHPTAPKILFHMLVGCYNNVNPLANLLGRPYRCMRCNEIRFD